MLGTESSRVPPAARWMATEYQKQIAWENAKRIRGKNPNLHRRDRFGNQICKPAYGAQGHAVPGLAGAPAGRSSIRTSASARPRPSCFALVSALDDSMAPISSSGSWSIDSGYRTTRLESTGLRGSSLGWPSPVRGRLRWSSRFPHTMRGTMRGPRSD